MAEFGSKGRLIAISGVRAPPPHPQAAKKQTRHHSLPPSPYPPRHSNANTCQEQKGGIEKQSSVWPRKEIQQDSKFRHEKAREEHITCVEISGTPRSSK